MHVVCIKKATLLHPHPAVLSGMYKSKHMKEKEFKDKVKFVF